MLISILIFLVEHWLLVSWCEFTHPTPTHPPTVCRFKGGELDKREQYTLTRLLSLISLSFPILNSLKYYD